MISLFELLNSVKNETKSGKIKIDSWRWPDVEYLFNMGFDFGDDYTLSINKSPKISIYKKKDIDPKTEKKVDYFFIEEPTRETKKFKTFNDVIDYFDNYVQPDLDEKK